MENEQKLGAGILTISIILLIGTVIGIFGVIIGLTVGDSINAIALESGQIDESMLLSSGDYVFSLITTLISGISVVLILMKNKYGIYGYFTIFILSNVYSLIMYGIAGIQPVSVILSVALAALYGFFIYKKRVLFGFSKETI